MGQTNSIPTPLDLVPFDMPEFPPIPTIPTGGGLQINTDTIDNVTSLDPTNQYKTLATLNIGEDLQKLADIDLSYLDPNNSRKLLDTAKDVITDPIGTAKDTAGKILNIGGNDSDDDNPVDTVIDTVTDTVDTVVDTVEDTTDTIIDTVQDPTLIFDTLDDKFDLQQLNMATLLDDQQDFIQDAFSSAQAANLKGLTTLTGTLTNAVNQSTGTINNAIDGVGDSIDNIGETFVASQQLLSNQVTDGFQGLTGTFTTAMNGIGASQQMLSNQLLAAQANNLQGFQNLTGTFTNAVNQSAGTLNNAIDGVENSIDNIGDTFLSSQQMLSNQLLSVQDTIGTLSNDLTTITSDISRMPAELTNSVGGQLGNVQNTLLIAGGVGIVGLLIMQQNKREA